MADQVSYQVGAASLFAGHARTAKYLCDWCGEPGEKECALVESYLVPKDHKECKQTIKAARKAFCYCFEFEGDNADCPIHGGK
jgi:hypothetical protein